MDTPETPEPWEQDLQRQVQAAVTAFGQASARMTRIFTAQGAMGWMFGGDLDKARASVAKLPTESLPDFSAAAAALVSLADEEITRRAANP